MSQPRPKIGIVMSTTREARFGEKPARWIHKLASRRADLDFGLIDCGTIRCRSSRNRSPALSPPTHKVARQWADKVANVDGFIFVVAEYNHGLPAVLKNALDYAYREFNRKPAAYVGYGGLGAALAIGRLRWINVTLQIAPLRTSVHISGRDFMALLQGDKTLGDMPELARSAERMLDELAWWAKALKSARTVSEQTRAA